jgi:hypothetical protein
LNGQYPRGAIDWGNNVWYLSGPYGAFNGNSVSFNGPGPRSAAFILAPPLAVRSVEAFNGGQRASTVSIGCAGQQTRRVSVPPNQRATLVTGWTRNCNPVTLTSSNGWETNFKNISIAFAQVTPTAMPARTPTTIGFDQLPNANRPLNGQYPDKVIDWGSNAWYLSGPYGDFQGNSLSFNGAGLTSASFTFVGPRNVVSIDASNGGQEDTTLSLACEGQPTRQLTIPAGRAATLRTNWSDICTTVTVSSTNGWDTNFDRLVIQ